MKTIPAILFASLAILTSCHQEKKSALTTINILDGLKTEKEFRLSEIVDNVEYVKLETSKECLFTQAQYLVGKRYILATQLYNPEQIFLFDRTGKFIRKIGGKGKGPLEYTSISTVVADPEETYILVNDYQRDILLKYDFEGTVTGTFKYKEKLGGNVADIMVKSPDEIFLRIDFPRLEKKNYFLIRKLDMDFNQIDSLYPVNTSTIQGNGFSWGRSLFYLHNGSIQFMQYSFDTLYGESKGRMIPRFIFPITADHLPGPYLVTGLHKQMFDYNCIWRFNELSDYLIFNANIVPKKGGLMIFNKSTGEIFNLKKYPPCPPDTLGRRALLNDVDGLINPMYFSCENGLFVASHQVIDLKENPDINCSVVTDIKFPAKRKELIDLVKSSHEDDNPILQVFHLR